MDKIACQEQEVGLQGAELPEHAHAPLVSRAQVQIGYVEDADGGSGLADGWRRHAHAPHAQPVRFDEDTVRAHGRCPQGGK
jgi:hypothetical protein